MHGEIGKEVKGLIGDYGETIRAPHYIVLTSREGDGYLTDAGFFASSRGSSKPLKGAWVRAGSGFYSRRPREEEGPASLQTLIPIGGGERI